MKRRLLVLMGAALTLTACGSPATATPEPQLITLTASDIKFDQTTLETTASQPVKLTITNSGVLEHDFAVLDIAVSDVKAEGGESAGHDMSNMTDAPDLHLAVKAGETQMLEFTPTEPGTYEFVCTVTGHKEAGMVGTLVVK